MPHSSLKLDQERPEDHDPRGRTNKKMLNAKLRSKVSTCHPLNYLGKLVKHFDQGISLITPMLQFDILTR